MLRHSTAHVLAEAVTRLFPGAKYAIGPAIADGFYYDFELPDGQTFSEDDLARIESEMREIVKARSALRARGALATTTRSSVFADQPYKREIIEKVRTGDAPTPRTRARPAATAAASRCTATSADGDGRASSTCAAARTCRRPSRLGAFKLTKVAGAYWRGNEKGPMLQRIYGTAWESKDALAEHLHRLEEAERRDHRKLGVELDLFSFPEEIGSGLAVFHPKGALVRRIMEEYSRQRHEASGYEFVNSPHITKAGLFETSGHLDWFADGMFPPMHLDEGGQGGEGTTYYLKPMNCPFHILIFKHRTRSYRELPLRFFEFGTVYRYEKSGVVHGLTRVRGMTQDDAHIFCTKEQMAGELVVAARLRARPAARLRPRRLLPRALDQAAGQGGRHRRGVGRGDRDVARRGARARASSSCSTRAAARSTARRSRCRRKDAIGRTWQMSTIQLDFQMPQRFDMHYIGADNERHRPIMIHRALFGSIERFFAVLVEHYAGAFPAWLAPVQVDGAAGRRPPRRVRVPRRRPVEGRGLPRRDGRRLGRRARHAHPPGQDREGAVRARRRRHRRRATARSA